MSSPMSTQTHLDKSILLNFLMILLKTMLPNTRSRTSLRSILAFDKLVRKKSCSSDKNRIKNSDKNRIKISYLKYSSH